MQLNNKYFILTTLFVFSMFSVQSQMIVEDSWTAWVNFSGSSSMFNVVKNRYSDSKAKINSIHIENALNNPQEYVLTQISQEYWGEKTVDLLEHNALLDEVDSVFAKGTSINTRTKWNDYIFNKMFQLSLKRQTDTLLIFNTGSKHCTDFYLRTLSVVKHEPKLQNVVYMGQIFYPGDQVGNQDYSDNLKEAGYSQWPTYAVGGAELAQYAEETSFMMLLSRYYSTQQHKPNYSDLTRTQRITQPEIVCFADIHPSMSKNQVWKGFPKAIDLKKKGIEKINIYYEGFSKKGVFGPEALWTSAYMDPDKTVVKNTETLKFMKRMIEMKKAGIEVTLQTLASRDMQ